MDEYHYTSTPIKINTRKRIHLSLYPINATGKYIKIFFLGRKKIDTGNNYMTSFDSISVRGVSFDFASFVGDLEMKLFENSSQHNHFRFVDCIYRYFLSNKNLSYLKENLFLFIKSIYLFIYFIIFIFIFIYFIFIYFIFIYFIFIYFIFIHFLLFLILK